MTLELFTLFGESSFEKQMKSVDTLPSEAHKHPEAYLPFGWSEAHRSCVDGSVGGHGAVLEALKVACSLGTVPSQDPL